LSLGTAAFCILVLGKIFGPLGFTVGAVGSFLGLAWRYDNQTGTCLPLAVLLLLVIGVMFLLIYLMVVTH